MEAILLCDFDILPAPAVEFVKPVECDGEFDEVDQFLVPVSLQQPSGCNCFKQPMKPTCLVDLLTHRVENDDDIQGDEEEEVDELNQLAQILELEDEDDSEPGEGYLLFVERFAVVGSWSEMVYQQALAVCSWRRCRKLPIEIKMEHEPGNIKDTNAIKFSVFHNNQWYVMGYCGIKKVPKLKKAMHKKEITAVNLDSLKRVFAPKERELLYCASLTIVKHGQWEKDDPRNNYNSHIDLH